MRIRLLVAAVIAVGSIVYGAIRPDLSGGEPLAPRAAASPSVEQQGLQADPGG